MLPMTKPNLKKLEVLAKELGYTVRYEKGNFQSGYCLVESRRVAIINRFFDTEGRINVLFDILSQFRPDETTLELSEPSAKLWKKLKPFLGIEAAEPNEAAAEEE
ncbi:hypothetical protein QWY85_09750 [Neolewinella lacunae]|uniref:Uncharacterized protein n=1 Tax=Neolewinella lacunae TaxID=1517758 RepID=A0A923T881_9BACT|nr:hypothetical protein [Neolewinella lacunae]MBC6994301.1 hypothetical protein [Neolewinella lacunae]MDN3634942.1 hypothetical protein [Neolewinella lacunae]